MVSEQEEVVSGMVGGVWVISGLSLGSPWSVFPSSQPGSCSWTPPPRQCSRLLCVSLCPVGTAHLCCIPITSEQQVLGACFWKE